MEDFVTKNAAENLNGLGTMDLFNYIPNKPLAIVGKVLFEIFAIFLAARVYLSKSAKLIYILPITALMECVGYLITIMCHDSTTLGKYIAMTLFLLLSPNALALVNYKAVGEIIRLSNVQTSCFFLLPEFVTWFFFSSYVWSFMMQGIGGGLQTSSKIMALVSRLPLLVFLFSWYSLDALSLSQFIFIVIPHATIILKDNQTLKETNYLSPYHSCFVIYSFDLSYC